MPDLAAQILAPTVVAAIVSGAAIIVREVLAGRLKQRDVLLREVESLWKRNHELRASEAFCQRRCRALSRRLSGVEQRCASLRDRLDQLARVVGSESATLRPKAIP